MYDCVVVDDGGAFTSMENNKSQGFFTSSCESTLEHVSGSHLKLRFEYRRGLESGPQSPTKAGFVRAVDPDRNLNTDTWNSKIRALLLVVSTAISLYVQAPGSLS